MSFSDTATKVVELYRKGRFSEALAVVARDRGLYPSEDATFTFWEACLLSMDGSPDEALSVLGRGLDRGLWWSAATLADSDLDAARRLGGWEEVLSASAAGAEAAATARPDARIARASVSEPRGSLVVLHGGGAKPEEVADDWEAAVGQDWTVMTPIGTVPAMPSRWSWPGEAEVAVAAVLDQLPEADWIHPTVVCGYSQGGRVALDLAAAEPGLHGLLLIAPAVRAEALPPVSDVPTVVHVGEEDWAIQGVESLVALLDEGGVPTRVERVAGLGHAMPRDLPSVVQRSIEWIESIPSSQGNALG